MFWSWLGFVVALVSCDDATKIQALIDTTDVGGVLQIRPGIYHLDAAVEITKPITIQAAGVTFESDEIGQFDGLLKLSGRDIVIDGLTMANTTDGSSHTVKQLGIELEGADRVTIRNCSFRSFRYCILGRAGAHNVNVSDCWFDTEPSGATAIVLNGDYCTIHNNHIVRFADTAIGVTGGASHSVISGNVIRCRPQHGSLGIIVEEDAENIIVSENIIDGNWDGRSRSNNGLAFGIRLADNRTGVCPKNVVVSNNIVRNVERYGIMLTNAGEGRDNSAIVLSGNIVSECGLNNYRFEDVSGLVASGNLSTAGIIGLWARNVDNSLVDGILSFGDQQPWDVVSLGLQIGEHFGFARRAK